ncbi:hypothetical protein SDC9_97673 [bioreactor metagenome]|uniref:Uncharacterized protein n=1 Tax=bioreactor metagenome TaxID=1076179 RepID=A0A645AD29_9ZZZZ
MRDFRHARVLKPFPGIVIVKIRNPLHVLTAAAEFADIVRQRRRPYQSNVHGQPRARGLTLRMQRDVAHAERMSRRVERHDLAADAQEFAVVALFNRFTEQRALIRNRACRNLFFRHWQKVQQRVERAFPLQVEQARKHGEVKFQRAFLAFIRPGRAGIRVQPGGKRLIGKRQDSFRGQVA